MNQKKVTRISRRDFAQRAILFSATATLAPAAITNAQSSLTPASHQDQPNLPKLEAASQAEADARLQQVIVLHGPQFDDGQKALLKTLCVMVQPSLDKVRAFPLANSDGPALVLKPLVEREKKPQAPHAAATPKNS
jgi:hypothetical protein